MTEPVHWSQGLRGTPQDYIRVGRLIGALELAERNAPAGLDLTGLGATPAELADLLDALEETDTEEQASWDAGDYEDELAELEAEAAALLGRDPRDLSNGYGGGELDLSALDFTEAVELAQQRRDQAMVRTRMARMIGLESGLRGDIHEMAACYLEAGTGGHRIELANQPGPDVSRQIELARATTGRYASICGSADAYGRCSAQFHAAECSHVAEAGASYGTTPEDSQGWRAVLNRHAAIPVADSHGQVAFDQHGLPMTAAAHIEALSGQRQGEGVFYAGRNRRELVTPQRHPVTGDPSADDPYPAGMPAATARTAAALAAQASLPTQRDAALQRLAWQHEHAQRIADRALRGGVRHHMDYGETSRERAERMHQPVALSNVDSGDDFGALPGFTYGQL